MSPSFRGLFSATIASTIFDSKSQLPGKTNKKKSRCVLQQKSRSQKKTQLKSNYLERGTVAVPWETTEELLHIKGPLRKRRNQFSLVKSNRQIKRTSLVKPVTS